MSAAFWTEERLQFLRRRVAEGASASQISADFESAVSRNSIIGKTHRLGLRLGRAAGHPAKIKPKPIDVDQAELPEPKARRLPRPKPTTTKARADVTITPPEPPPVVQPPEPEPGPALDTAGRLRLDDLRSTSCRWPLGDPRDDDFGFCGAERGPTATYCPPHARLAYQPASERRAHDRSVRSGVRA